MHERARGHRFEPCNSHFFMSKNEKETKQGRTAQQEDTKLSAGTPVFYA